MASIGKAFCSDPIRMSNLTSFVTGHLKVFNDLFSSASAGVMKDPSKVTEHLHKHSPLMMLHTTHRAVSVSADEGQSVV